MKKTVLLFIAVIAIALSSKSHAAVDFCNYSDDVVVFSVAGVYGLRMFSRHWQADGWYRVGEGDCRTIHEPENVRVELMFAIAKKRWNGWTFLDESDFNMKEQGRSWYGDKVEYGKRSVTICLPDSENRFSFSKRQEVMFNQNCDPDTQTIVPFSIWVLNSVKVRRTIVMYNGDTVNVR